MASDEILIKVSADLSDLKEGFANNEELWRRHNDSVSKGEKAIKNYADSTVRENKKVDKAIQANIDKIVAEAKALDSLEKNLDSLNKKNDKAFDSKNLNNFNTILNELSKNIGNLEQFNIDTDDIAYLTKELSAAQDDFEALNILVDFFEKKMKSSASAVTDSFDVIQKKIEETKINIASTEGYIKDMDKKIASTGPGQAQANLIQERNAAIQALKEEKVALMDYEAQLKKVRAENISMTTQLRKVKDELIQLDLAGERGGARWIQLSEEAKKYNTAIRDTNAELARTSKHTAGLDNLIGAATGIVALFTAAQGAAALFGDESEELQKSLVKVTGAIALLNGLQAIQTELTKKETIAARGLNLVRKQYAIATDSGTKATLRLAAATKLLGIGLLVGALAAIVVYWKDISKWIGMTSEKKEAFTKVNKKAVESIGNEIGKLKALQSELSNANTPLSRQREIKADLLKQYPTYLKALGDEKSSVEDIEAAFDNLNAALLLNAKITAAREVLSEKFKEVLEAERKALAGEAETYQTVLNTVKMVVAPAASNVFDDQIDAVKNLAKAKEEFDSFEKFLSEFIASSNEELAMLGGDPTKDGDLLKKYKTEFDKLSKLLSSLVDEQEAYRIEAIENSREKEKEILRAKLNDEKENYKKQIDDLKIAESQKAKLRAEFNKLYNEESGAAYEQLRKEIAKIDDKYNAELESVQFKALSAIDSVLVSEAENDRKAIQDRWDDIRDEIQAQIDKTDDEFKKEGLESILVEIEVAESKELKDFDLNDSLDRVDREKEIAQAILAIQQANIKNVIKNEKLKQSQLLNLEKQYLKEIISTYSSSFENLLDKGLFDELTETLANSVDADEVQEAANKLREAFGDDTADEILKTVAALKEVKNEIQNIGSTSNFQGIVDDIGEWTNSIESFAKKLAESLGLEGGAAIEFAEGVAVAIATTYESLLTIFQAEIDEHRNKIDSLQESIDTVEDELEREQKLYEDGYANNYEARKADLEDLKARKAEEEEELKKAQQRKAILAKAEFTIDTVSQLTSLITASTNIFKWASAIPFVGVPLAIGLISAMFGAFAVAKTKAFQAIGSGQNFRKGLGEGALSLSGPTHEERGFGLYNSKTGERVAEFEDGEDVLVVNRSQKKKYKRIIDALIADAQGRGNLDSTLEGYYGVPSVGQDSLRIVKNVNEITVKSQRSKEESSAKDLELLKEIKELKESFQNEFNGHKKKQEDKVESWETKEYYHVKKGNVTKKYKK